MPDIHDALNILENALRDVIEAQLQAEHGDDWISHIGVTPERMERWKSRRDEEPKRRTGGQVEQRLLYYADFFDVASIIERNWDTGFKDCFRDRKRFDVYMDRLGALRDPDAHSRSLLPFEEYLVLGMTGELRQAIALHMSSGLSGAEPEHFARIDEVIDSFGQRAVGKAMSGRIGFASPVILRPGTAWCSEDMLGIPTVIQSSGPRRSSVTMRKKSLRVNASSGSGTSRRMTCPRVRSYDFGFTPLSVNTRG